MSFFQTTKYDKFEVSLPGGRAKSFAFTPENSRSMDNARRERDAFCREYEDKATATAGRPITTAEWQAGRLTPALDSRDFARKMRDEKFTSKPKDARTAIDKEIERQQAKVEQEDYAKLSTEQQRLKELLDVKAKREAEADATMSHEQRLIKYAETLDRLRARQDHLRWSPTTDEAEWITVEQAIQLIETPGSDLRALSPRLEELNRLDEIRGLARQAEFEKKRAELEAEAMELEQHSPAPFLAEPEPAEVEPAAEPAKAHTPKTVTYATFPSGNRHVVPEGVTIPDCLGATIETVEQ